MARLTMTNAWHVADRRAARRVVDVLVQALGVGGQAKKPRGTGTLRQVARRGGLPVSVLSSIRSGKQRYIAVETMARLQGLLRAARRQLPMSEAEDLAYDQACAFGAPLAPPEPAGLVINGSVYNAVGMPLATDQLAAIDRAAHPRAREEYLDGHFPTGQVYHMKLDSLDEVERILSKRFRGLLRRPRFEFCTRGRVICLRRRG